ncbi:hypothetical protein [Ruegeria sp.]|uniref:hypothetical protein n=1 Tax=Ruegeria sp. TaxID=1879320 RepID=UPI00231E0CC5|nr:hypothetical protein [Ruegeria sp.]MDA7966263.1 hypothetical protein [Ruegeria sp.]
MAAELSRIVKEAATVSYFRIKFGNLAASIHCLPSFSLAQGLPKALASGGSFSVRSKALSFRRARLCSAFLKGLSLTAVVMPVIGVLRRDLDILLPLYVVFEFVRVSVGWQSPAAPQELFSDLRSGPPAAFDIFAVSRMQTALYQLRNDAVV